MVVSIIIFFFLFCIASNCFKAIAFCTYWCSGWKVLCSNLGTGFHNELTINGPVHYLRQSGSGGLCPGQLEPHVDIEGRKCLFNDAINTFYFRLYCVRHMVKDHSVIQRGNLLPPHGLLSDLKQGLFYLHHPTYRISHTTALLHQSWSTGWNEMNMDINTKKSTNKYKEVEKTQLVIRYHLFHELFQSELMEC